MTSLVLMPLFTFTENAQAQGGLSSYTAAGAYLGGSSSGGSSANLQTYVKGLAPTIAALPGCKEVLKNGTGQLFSKIKSAFTSKSKKKKAADKSSNPISDGSTGDFDSILIKLENTQATDLKNAADSTEKTSKSSESINRNKTCLDGIGRAVTKLLLQRITVSTVNWINGGYEGKPTYIQDPEGFFSDIAKNEILQFGSEISNETLFPFGQAFMEAQAQSFQRHFADNAQYSLNKLISDTNPQYSSATFSTDFSQGGWAAWDAMTQIPANNPLGFQLLASNELQFRLEGTAKSTAQYFKDDLDRAKGFMSQVRCADPEGMTKELNDALIANGDTAGACKKWIYVTPGSLIADAASDAVKYPKDSLLKSEDLNDAVAAILDAVINQWSTNLFSNTGFAGISPQGADGSYFHNTNAEVSYNTQVENDFPNSVDSTWLSENPDFNIRTGLTQALIDEQRIYKEKLEEQNTQLFTSVKTTKQATDLGLNPNYRSNYGLLPLIYQLDYCIPGPHPGFEEDAQASLAKALSVGGTPIGETNLDKALGFLTTLDSYNPLGSLAGPTSASGTIGTILNLINPDKDIQAARNNSRMLIRNFAGVDLGTSGTTPIDFDGVTVVLQSIVDGYINVVHNIFSPIIMPDATKEAATEFKKTSGYLKMMEDNVAYISSLKSIVARLAQIKSAVDTLNQELINNTIKNSSGVIVPLANQNEQYEENLKPWISAFGRLTDEMVTGDDIAKADNLLKQIKDKQIYIYNNLIKGPTGCEQQLYYDPTRPNLPLAFTQYRRYIYPLPIIYDYNNYNRALNSWDQPVNFAPNPEILPDPLYNPLSNNPKSLFTKNNAGYKAAFKNQLWSNGKDVDPGLYMAGFGTNPQYSGGQTEAITFCTAIQNITGIQGNCSAYEGPTFIDIRFVNIFQDANNLTKLERSLGIY